MGSRGGGGKAVQGVVKGQLPLSTLHEGSDDRRGMEEGMEGGRGEGGRKDGGSLPLHCKSGRG